MPNQIMLNLGSSTKTSPLFINIDWTPLLWVAKHKFLRNVISYVFLDTARRVRLAKLSDEIFVHNLAKGIPFADGSVDVAYHSHLLEHLDREIAPVFLSEIFRVLKPGGLHRICVPDMEILARSYMASVDRFMKDGVTQGHEESLSAILEQSVRREAFGTSRQPKLRRLLENFLFGDARRRGETHQWMYDRVNLPALLLSMGFTEIHVCSWNESEIENWIQGGLEFGENLNEYKVGSLYVECRKPILKLN